MPLRIPLPSFRRHRSRSGPIALPSLALLSATVTSYEGTDLTVELVFDNAPGDAIADVDYADPTKWTATYDGVAWVGNGQMELVSFNTVQLYMGATGEGPGANVLSYAADPSDVRTGSGLELAAFAGRVLA